MHRDQILTAAGETIAYAEDYIETRIHLAKLTVAEQGSKTAADLIAFAVIGLFRFVRALCVLGSSGNSHRPSY